MKALINEYSFNAISGEITFTAFANIELHKVLIITNVTRNEIIYNFACTGFGGTESANVLSLDYDTSTHSNTDELLIYYDLGNLTSKIHEVNKNLSYIGKAQIGTLSSAALWQIQKISTAAGITTVSWADGDDKFNNVWDNRLVIPFI